MWLLWIGWRDLALGRSDWIETEGSPGRAVAMWSGRGAAALTARCQVSAGLQCIQKQTNTPYHLKLQQITMWSLYNSCIADLFTTLHINKVGRVILKKKRCENKSLTVVSLRTRPPRWDEYCLQNLIIFALVFFIFLNGFSSETDFKKPIRK